MSQASDNEAFARRVQRRLIEQGHQIELDGWAGSKTVAAFESEMALGTARPVAEVEPEPEWMTIARSEIGVREFAGDADNPQVVEYFKAIDGPFAIQGQDETAWCSAFVNWCFDRAGIAGTRSPAARSWTRWGQAIEAPVVGCVAVLWRGSPSGWQGHVGFYIRETSDYIWLLGGNQNDAVSIARYPKKRLLGYRMPTRGMGGA